ncbi:FAD/NAD-P-binding domain-containing protein [Vararia minispora EC-137]|uniref:FAD/NAD-P-binding domain-containing protein n=1 Tax=Vararia minispora EC-137 TaxID=1314806 RepID=A0ACB8QVY1_9AGAM|nr:FAD/NAD-P-binding domain-containing protein [Vararia minispora EC-137]
MRCRLSVHTLPVLAAQCVLAAAFSPAQEPRSTPHRIAVVGAGAGGSSAAFWLSKARERNALDVIVDVYERADYVGGRATIVYPYDNRSLAPIELGASLYAPGNLDMVRAVAEFGLSNTSFGIGNAEVDGFWDGKTIGGAAGDGQFIARYGLETIGNAQVAPQTVVGAVGSLYAPTRPVWNTTSALVNALNWAAMLSSTGAEFYTTQNVSRLFIDELIEALSRANYCQDVNKMHAIGVTIGLATTGAVSVAGGNRQVFENFVKASGATLKLNTEAVQVYSILPAGGRWILKSSAGVRTYDAVILAAPFHLSNIALPPSFSSTIPPQPYKRVHVTLLTTTSPSFNTAYLGAQNVITPPTSVFITLNATRRPGGPVFNSLQRLAVLNGTGKGGKDESLVKIFSDEVLSDAFLDELVGERGWTFKHTWDAFPILTPATSFPPVHVAKGLYYVNALEPVVSTMETETIAARNVVDLLLSEQFASGICPPGQELASNATGFVYGWDC